MHMPGTRPVQHLRFMIDKALAEAGIVIAFPQRDVHLNADKPVRIELSRSPKSDKPTGNKP